MTSVATPASAEAVRYRKEAMYAQARWLTLSSNRRQVTVNDSSEYVQFDRPDVVVDTIHEAWNAGSGRRQRP